MFQFRFPDVGEGITEGEIVKWRVNEGDTVKEHDIVADIETDKAIVEIPTPKPGRILRIHHKEGDTVKVGEVLVTIGEAGEEYSESEAAKEKAEPKTAKEEKFEAVVGTIPGKEEGIVATPATRKMARDMKVDISKIKGTGPGGRITDEDVKRASRPAAAQVKLKYDFYGYVDHVPFKGVRRSTARHLAESWRNAVHVTSMDDVDATELAAVREREKKAAEERGIHLTFLPYMAKALVAALKEHPLLNSTLDEENEDIIVRKYYNIGIAVDTPDGLIVPVVKGVDQKDVLSLAKEMQELAERTRERKLDLADLKGGTFTITNVGTFGGTYATPIINYPEAAILLTGRMMDKPVVKYGKVEIRKVLPLSLTFDHRIFDGAEASKFMNDLKKHLETLDFLK